jgi:hypothetical protein
MSSSLTLDNIRSSLIRQEDSIIFNFIERAQFAANPVVYQAGGVQVPGKGGSHSWQGQTQQVLGHKATAQWFSAVNQFVGPCITSCRSHRPPFLPAKLSGSS